MDHKFSIEQVVDLERDHHSRKKPTGPFKILRRLPMEDSQDERSYRIQSLLDRHERVVTKSALGEIPAQVWASS